MLNISGKSGHPCFVPDLGGKTFNFSPLSMLAVGIFYMAFIMLSYIYSIPNLLRVFGYEKMLNFVKCSFSNYWGDYTIFIFHYVNVLYHIYWSVYFSHPYMKGINPTRPWCMILLKCYWIQFVSILLRTFASMFIRYIGLQFYFLVMPLSDFPRRVMLVS